MSIEFETSSGNVFEDIKVANPDESFAKAELARRITSIIKHRHMKQQNAAETLGIDQPKISRLLRGHLSEFSLEKLLSLVMRLDRDIEIVIKKRPKNRVTSHMTVAAI